MIHKKMQYFLKYSSNQAKQTQHLTEMLTPELEKAMKKEERMVKDLEQVEQEGKAYRLQLEGFLFELQKVFHFQPTTDLPTLH